MEAYKLTNSKMQTYNHTQWIIDEWKEATGDGKELCTDGYLHFYDDPLLAVFFNSIHASFDNPRLFIAETDGEKLDDRGIKYGYKRGRLIEEIGLPVITTKQRIEISIRAAYEVVKPIKKPWAKKWLKWADDWLSNKDRSADAADAASSASASSASAASAITASSAASASSAYPAYAARASAAAANAATEKGIDILSIIKQVTKK